MNNIILKTKVKVTSSQVDKNKIRVEKKKKQRAEQYVHCQVLYG